MDHLQAPGRDWLARTLKSHYGIAGEIQPFPGEFDVNAAVVIDGKSTYFLKVMRPDCPPAFIDMQCGALEHIARHGGDAPVPRLVRSRDGRPHVTVADEFGRSRIIWLLTAIPGRLYANVRPQAAGLRYALGVALARIDQALEGFDHADLDRPDKWRLTTADWILGQLDAIPNNARRGLVKHIGEHFASALQPRLHALPSHPIHNDANDYNIIVEAMDPTGVAGIIDFGDMMREPRVVDLAIAGAYALLGQARPIAALAEVVAGFNSVLPLADDELALLYPLALTRLAVSVTNSSIMSRERPDDAYTVVTQAPAWSFLESAANVDPAFATAVLRRACGHRGHPASERIERHLHTRSGPRVAILGFHLRDAPVVDFSVAGDCSPSDPRHLDREEMYRQVQRALPVSGFAIGRYREPRLLYSGPAFVTETEFARNRRSVHAGLDLYAPAGHPVYAPLDGVVEHVEYRGDALDYGGVVTLAHRADDGTPFWTLYGHLGREVTLRLRAGMALSAGQQLATIGAPSENGGWPTHLHLQVSVTPLAGGADWPGAVDPDDADPWFDLFPSPASLAGVEPRCADGTPVADEDLAERRRVRSARNLKLSYTRPITMVRGFRHYLYDQHGREYVDAYNNVPHVGHAHPRVVAAAARQWQRLNTNTRYLHPLHVEYAEALVAKFPDPLRVCLFVNSGSEANELALRLARAKTAGRDMVVLEDGYHGNTNTAIDISHYKFARRGGRGAPDWIQVATLPDPYRGPFRGPDTAGHYAASVDAALARIAALGRQPAGFICETYPSVGGQIVPPSGYLRRVYASVRAAGGLCIADEVQTGFGRIGEQFWGFASQGVVPDIVVLGKPIGNGHPIGAVVTTREIFDAFANGMEFFSTFGGSSVSCAIGHEVLRIVEDEGVPARAAAVGGGLKRALTELSARFPLIGDVRGDGLFLGLELVNDPERRDPATTQADYIVNRMRDKRVLIGTEGRDDSVLKIRPPLSFDDEAADRLVACLAETLAEDGARPH